MKLPQEVVTKSLNLDSYTYSKTTGFTILYRSMNRMPSLSVIVIKYPPSSVNFNVTADIYCELTINSEAYTHICKLDKQRKEITFQIWSPSGSKTKLTKIPTNSLISLTVKDFYLQAPHMGSSSDSFSLASFTDKTRLHSIDVISGGLLIYSCSDGQYPNLVDKTCKDCVVPCNTCTKVGTVCLSCDIYS